MAYLELLCQEHNWFVHILEIKKSIIFEIKEFYRKLIFIVFLYILKGQI